ncbi:MAG: type II toxin-antitoxin system RelE/ParE family toxin [Lachnospiraceae bacterium]|nr:type II toxin-antitoxin system RelE/ParE family toxin [Lachnospiraceae bacterium]
MKNVELSPEAVNDLVRLKEYMTENFGTNRASKIVKGIMADLKTLGEHPDSGSKNLFVRFDIETEYSYLVTHKNYAFYRVEGDSVKVIRVLDTRRDVIYILFGVKVVDDYSEYWDE